MKKLFISLFAVVLLLLTSCKINFPNVVQNDSTVFQNSRTRQLDKLTSEESVVITQMSTDIIKCFTERDKEALKELFCEKIRNRPEFDDEIDKAFEYCKCDVYITSTIKDSAGAGGEHIEKGKRISWYITAEIPHFEVLIETSPGNMETYDYSIWYYWRIIDEKEPSLEGLHCIYIELSDVDKIKIGERLVY